MHMCADIIASVPFFEDAEEGFTTSLVTCLRLQICLKGDVIVREGEVSRDMYFIKAGAAQAGLFLRSRFEIHVAIAVEIQAGGCM